MSIRNLICRVTNRLHTTDRRLSTKIPKHPTWEKVEESALPPEAEITSDLVNHLERLALVDFGNREGVERLSAAVRFADQLSLVDTTGVTPMYTVLGDQTLYQRHDEVTEGGCRKEILKNAKKIEDEYFVAPPGNIPLAKKERTYGDDTDSSSS